jgi:DNA repair exonuclease SbcCD nuclease subunit
MSRVRANDPSGRDRTSVDYDRIEQGIEGRHTMIRFLHTSDWQIGMKAVHVGAAGERVREARLEAARNVIEAARARDVAFVLLAGDTFEDNAVDRALVRRVVEVLRASPVPVLVLPGNHDPLVPGSVFESPEFHSAGTAIRVLCTPEPVHVAGATIHPCPLREKHGRADPTGAIPPGRDGGFRIGLAHGTLRAAGVEGDDDFPIDPSAPERLGLDYLALGHWHSHFEARGRDGVTRVAYSGTHEQTKFGEPASGRALVVTIEEPGAPPRIEPVRTGLLRWHRLDCDVFAAADLERVVLDLQDLPHPSRMLVEVTLRGTLAAGVLSDLDRIEELLANRFLFGRLDASSVLPSPADASWIEELPPGSAQGAARRLLAVASGATSDTEASAEVACEALALLYSLAKETSR